MNVKPMLTLAAVCSVWLPAVMAQPESPAAKTTHEEDTAGDESTDMTIRYEVFSLEPAKAAVMRRQKPEDVTFYATLVGLLEKGETVQEAFSVIRCGSGNKANTESVTSLMYPVEYGSSPLASPDEKVTTSCTDRTIVVPLLPSAIEARNTGEELEIEPTAGFELSDIDLRIAPTHTWLAERTTWGTGTSASDMPVFESQKFETSMSVSPGKPFLLGTLSPRPAKLQPKRIWFAFATTLRGAQPATEPSAQKGAAADEPNPPPTLSFTYEVFSLPLKEAAALQRKEPGDGELYQDLVTRASKNLAAQESLTMIRCRSGSEMATGDRNYESIAPTEFSPGTGSPVPANIVPPAAPALSTAFETKQCGLQLEISPTLSKNLKTVSVHLEASHVALTGRVKWGKSLSEIELPTYETQRLKTSFHAHLGSPCFIGTINPPQAADAKDTSDKRVWFAFITPDLAK